MTPCKIASMTHVWWHYHVGLIYYKKWWRKLYQAINHYFSFGDLIKNLFSPWKRISSSSGSHASVSKRWEAFTFNSVSRFMGGSVRIVLFIAGIFAYVFATGLATLGFLLWLVYPPISRSMHTRYKLLFLPQDLSKSGSIPMEKLFDNPAGHFFLTHLGISSADLLDAATNNAIQTKPNTSSFTDLISTALEQNIWTPDFLRNRQLTADDFRATASWWDYQAIQKYQVIPQTDFGPSFGSTLTFGYTPNLDKYASDLRRTKLTSADIPRPDTINRLERSVVAGKSVILVGPPGVGKKAAILAVVKNMANNRHFLEVGLNEILSESIYDINGKKALLTKTLKEANSAGNVTIIIRDIHRFVSSNVDGFDFSDVIETQIEKGLQIIALSTNSDYEKYLSPNLKIRKLFESIEITPPNLSETLDILIARAQEWESKKHLTILTPALRKTVTLADKYLTDLPFPTKAVELLDAAIAYKTQQRGSTITPTDIGHILSEKTGIPMTNLSASDKQKLATLEDNIHARLVGQDLAVSLIARSLRARATGLGGENKPVGSFLFLGPTGVGKTETAKALAEVYYGSENQIMRFDMAEYAHQDGLMRLLGSAQYNIPGTLTTAIKNHAAGLLLLDEIEKAPPQIFNLFLTLLDEGYITDAFGRKINAQHLFIIATSNAGSEVIRELVGQGIVGENLQKLVLEHILKNGYFSPEFINRFDAAVVYQPLSATDLVHIAQLQLTSLQHRMLEQNIRLDIDTSAIQHLATRGYDPAFGARPMKRLIDLSIADMLSQAILAGKINPGDHITLTGHNDLFSWQHVTQK